jgi:hypothetical protein
MVRIGKGTTGKDFPVKNKLKGIFMPDIEVVSKLKEEYAGDFYSDLMEQYKLMRSTITDLQNDRNTNNRFLISICTALFGIEGLIMRQLLIEDNGDIFYLLIASSILPVLGGYISLLWVKWGTSYAVALRTRYRLLKGIEAHFPSQPFTREFTLRSKEGYTAISDIAVNLSKFFLAGFVLMFIFSIAHVCF